MKKNKPKIYDCFMLFDEIELLKIRLEELYNFVDYFVIVEATTKYSGEKKSLNFKGHEKEFKKFKDKIIYIPVKHPKFSLLDKFYIWVNKKIKRNWITVSGFLFGLGIWKMEVFQRTQLKNGLTGCNDEDVVMLSDLDEIPNTKIFPLIKKKCGQNKLVWLEQKDYRYFLNGKLKNTWLGTKAISFKCLKKYYRGNPAEIRYGLLFAIRKRLNLNPKISYIKNGGWHFSYLGGLKGVMEKVKHFASMGLYGSEDDNLKVSNEEYIRQCLDDGIIAWDKSKKLSYVKIDKTFPITVYRKRKNLKHLIKKNNAKP